MIILFQVAILILSAAWHEWAHAFAAWRLGDDTAKRLGRLSLNPLVHLDWFGSFLLPLLMILSGMGFVFGYAKPVPFNPNKLRDWRFGPAKIAAAGPIANLILASFLSLLLRFNLESSFALLLAWAVFINILLAVFNLIPLPPLDGSKIVAAFLPWKWQEKIFRKEIFILPFTMIIIFTFFSYLLPLVSYVFVLLAGENSLNLLFNNSL